MLITDRYPGTVHHQLVELGYVTSAHHATGPSVAFNVQPRPTGQLLIGSSREFDDTSRNLNFPMLEQMLRRAVDYLPGCATAMPSAAGPACAPPPPMACRFSAPTPPGGPCGWPWATKAWA